MSGSYILVLSGLLCFEENKCLERAFHDVACKIRRTIRTRRAIKRQGIVEVPPRRLWMIVTVCKSKS